MQIDTIAYVRFLEIGTLKVFQEKIYWYFQFLKKVKIK
jgi:hypothetical protein